MKKILCLLLMLTVVLGLCACGCTHDWEAATCQTPKTCSKCGATEGEVTAHVWKQDENGFHICSLCGRVQDAQRDPEGDEQDTDPTVTLNEDEQAALETAQGHLERMAFSRQGLIDLLVYEGFTQEAAEVAVDHCGADWQAQAVRSGEEYVEYLAISHAGLRPMLEFELFTQDEIDYAMKQLEDIDWDAEAAEYVLQELNDGVSYSGLMAQMEEEGFTEGQIQDAIASAGEVDWNAQAQLCAQGYLEYMEFSRDELVSQLEYEGFTSAQAAYAADQCGL